MAAEYHDPNLKRRTTDMLKKIGLAGLSYGEHEQAALEPEPYEPPPPLREPPVRIEAITPIRAMSAWRFNAPEQIDVSLYGMIAVGMAVLFFLFFWVFSTFPLAVKIAGIGGVFAAVGFALLGLSYWIARRG